jgi:hypothetical protein
MGKNQKPAVVKPLKVPAGKKAIAIWCCGYSIDAFILYVPVDFHIKSGTEVTIGRNRVTIAKSFVGPMKKWNGVMLKFQDELSNSASALGNFDRWSAAINRSA